MTTLLHISKSMIILTLIMCFCIPAYAADAPSILSEEQITQTVDSYIEEHEDTTAAVSVAVFTKENILYEKQSGYINIEKNVANDKKVVFDWGSTGKLLVWVSIMQLAEQDKIDLDADIRTYLPDGFLTKLKYDDKITMINLMNHTGGWQESEIEIFIDNEDKIRSLENALKALEPAQVYKPGEIVAYSNFGAALAGYIVECISGMPFYEYVNKNIFIPVGMEHTSIKPDRSDDLQARNQRHKLYSYDIYNKALGIKDEFVSIYPAGSAVGTISDYTSFAQALLPDKEGGSVLFSKADTLVEFYEPTDFYYDGTPRDLHGMLTSPSLKGQVAGHPGNTLGCSSNLLIDLERGFGAVVMTNQKDESIYNYGLMEQIFGRIDAISEKPLHDDDIINGLYRVSNNYLTGIQKIRRLMDLPPISITEKNFINHDLNQIKPGVFYDRPDRVLFYTDPDKSGQAQVINAFAVDLVRVSYFDHATDWAIFFLYSAAMYYSIVYMVLSIIQMIRKREKPRNASRMFLCSTVLVAELNMLVFHSMAVDMTSTITSVYINGLIFILLGLAPIFYGTFFAVKHMPLNKEKLRSLTKKQKINICINMTIGAILVIHVLYWELWMFWV